MSEEVFEPGYESEVAIIGMAGRFPGARNVDEFWQNLQDGVESISFFSDQELEAAGVDAVLLSHPNYIKSRPILTEIELFDAAFFGFNPREAALMDPQHRLFLECAWEALENAGYNPKTYEGRIGVYGGVGINGYLFNLYSSPDLMGSMGVFQTTISNDKDYLSTRVSYKLNLKGPSVTVQTACSTSLVATHLAWQSLLNGECDMALIGGVTVRVPQKVGYLYQEGMITSSDGHCRAFDARASGTIFGSGVGAVLLKRLADALADGDCIHAVIKGSAINNDGSAKVGYTAPSQDAQAKAISEALAMARVEPETITYIETHGTGTPLGDPIEIAALTQAFRARTEKKGFCAIGSVKANIGHLDTAAGVTGLIKSTLALKHKLLPPSLNFERPNPKIDFDNSPFYVNTALTEWKTDGNPRRAGVSSFGIGGTNVHLILEEGPAVEPSGESRPWNLLLISAKSSSALETATTNLVEYLKQHPDLNLADVAYTSQVGREAFDHRRMLVCRDLEDAMEALETRDPKRVLTSFQEPKHRPVVFMFPGQGAQYVNMALELYQSEPTFREQVDRCSELLQPLLGLDLWSVLYPDQMQSEEAARQLEQTWITQPALFVIEYALARLWMEWGACPEAMIGHSIGEYVAACLAGVFSLEDALTLVAARGQLMQELPGGAMLSVPLSEEKLQPLLGEKVSVAAINGPSRCVVSGSTDAVDALERQLTEKGLGCRRLHTSHAFHSEMMEPILGPFLEQVKQVTLKPPQTPYLSNVTGTWITETEATDPGYWVRHLRQTVRFADGLGELLEEAAWFLLEVGPGRTLSTLARRHPGSAVEQVTLTSLPHPQDRQPARAFLLNTLGRLWLAGAQVDWAGFNAPERRHRLPLPTYPFERQRYWIERSTQTGGGYLGASAEETSRKESDLVLRYSRPNLPTAYVAPGSEIEHSLANIWQKHLGVKPIGIHDNFFDLGGDSVLTIQIVAELDRADIPLTTAQLFEYATIAELAAVTGTATPVEAEQGLVTGPLPILVPFQLLDVFENDPPSPHYHTQTWLFEAQEAVDPELMGQAVKYLMMHHDGLRLRFVRDRSGEWHQFNAGLEGETPFYRTDLSDLPVDERRSAMEAKAEEVQSSLNLEKGPIVRFDLYDLGVEKPDYLQVTMHHLIADSTAWLIVLQDLLTAYLQLGRGEAIQLPLKSTSFKRWTEQLAEYAHSPKLLQESDYWMAELQGGVAPLPKDYPDGVFTWGSRRTLLATLSPEETRALLQGIPKTYGAQIQEVLLAAVLQAFAKWTGEPSILVEIGTHGREPRFEGIDVSRTVGAFLVVYPLLLTLEEGHSDAKEILESVMKKFRSVADGGFGYPLLYRTSEPTEAIQELRALPQAQMLYSHWGQVDQLWEGTPFKIDPWETNARAHPERIQSRLIDIYSQVYEGCLGVNWVYSENVHHRSTIESLAQDVLEALRAILARVEIEPSTQVGKGHLGTSAGGTSRKKLDIADWFYIPSWKSGLLPVPLKPEAEQQTCWLVFSDVCGVGDQMAARLEQAGHTVIRVGEGQHFARSSEREFTVNPRRRDDYFALFSELHALDKLPERVLHLWGITPDDKGLSGFELFEEAQHSGFYSLLFLTQALEGQKLTDALQVWIVTNNMQAVAGETFLCPAKATVLGPAKVIPQEYPHITCHSIDIVLPERGTWQAKRLTDQLLAEIWAGPPDLAIAYRDQQRLVQTFEAVRLNREADPSTLLRENGVYLITEGLDGIGFALAETIAQAVRANLILVEDTTFPSADQWEGWLATHYSYGRISRKIRNAQALELMGTEVLVVQADVSNCEQMQAVIAQVDERFGELHGVIYAAGVVGERPPNAIEDTDQSEYIQHVQSKVSGLFVLEQILQGRTLDFCLLQSSLSTVLGGLGAVADTATHLFMGAFAHQHNRRNPTLWTSVHWDQWQLGEERETPATIGAGLAELAMTPKEGQEAFRYILSGGAATQIVLSTGDLQTRINQWIELEPIRRLQSDSVPRHPRPNLPTAYVAPSSEIERSLVNIWQGLLGVEPIGVHDNFFELGGDSVLLIQAVAKVNQAGIPLTLKQLYEHATIAELAAVAGTGTPVQAEQGPVTGPLPTLTPIQILEVFDGDPPAPHHRTQAWLFKARQTLDPELLEQAVRHLMIHHDALRLRFVRLESGHWRQFNAGLEVETPFYRTDLSALPAEQQRSALEAAAEELQASLNLTQGPIVRFDLFELNVQKPTSYLLVTLHHLITDSATWHIVLGDLQTAFQQLSRGEAIQLPPKTTSLKCWTEQLVEYARSPELLQELDYWLAEPRSRVASLPKDYPDGVFTWDSMRMLQTALSPEETRTLLQEVPQTYGAQIQEVMLTALLQAFARWAGGPSLLVEVAHHGRDPRFEGIDVSRTAGPFLVDYAMLLTLEEAHSHLREIDSPGIRRVTAVFHSKLLSHSRRSQAFKQLLGGVRIFYKVYRLFAKLSLPYRIQESRVVLAAVQEQMRRVPDGGFGFPMLYYLGEPTPAIQQLRALPKAEILYSHWGQLDHLWQEALLEPDPLSITSRAHPKRIIPRLMDIYSQVFEDRLGINWVYSENIYRRSTIELLAWGVIEALRTILAGVDN